jgi:drug/metabolite transporter (DMT)-like permease
MQPNQKQILAAQIKLAATMLVWGGSFIAIKIAVGEVSPITVVWLRFLIGSLMLGWIAFRRKELELPARQDILKLAGIGFLGVTFQQWLQSNGLVTSDASTTAWISSTTPIFMVLISWFFLKEKPDWILIFGIILATTGMLLVISKGDLESMQYGDFGKPGDLLIFISAVNWAIFSLVSRPLLKRYSAIPFTFYTMSFGWLFTNIQFLAGAKWNELSQFSINGWVSIIFLGVICSVLAYTFYNDGLRVLPASQVGLFLYLEPLAATLTAALILSEQIIPVTLLGGGLIIFGVWLVNRVDAGSKS